TVDLEKLEPVVPSSAAAAERFRRGLAALGECDYPDAREWLESAVLEAPARLDYYCYLIVAEIGVGDEEAALARLTHLARLQMSGELDGGYIHRRLEPVQGLVRDRLSALQERARIELMKRQDAPLESAQAGHSR